MVSMIDHRKVEGAAKFTPWLPRVYKFGGLVRVHWLYWHIRFFTQETGK